MYLWLNRFVEFGFFQFVSLVLSTQIKFSKHGSYFLHLIRGKRASRIHLRLIRKLKVMSVTVVVLVAAAKAAPLIFEIGDKTRAEDRETR